MKKILNFKAVLQSLLVLLLIFSVLLTGIAPIGSGQAASPRVAYVYISDTTTRDQFNTMLTGKGITVDNYTVSEAATANFTPDDTIILSDDSGGPGGFPPNAFNNIQSSAKPVLGIGLGGVVFFGQASLLMTQGGSSLASAYDVHAADIYVPIWQTPNQVSLLNQVMSIYTAAVSIWVYSDPDPIQFVNRIGRLVGDPNHYSLIAESFGSTCYSFWGYRGSPTVMTPSGANLFVNMALGSPCTAGTYSLNSGWLFGTPPAMDGILNYGEWSLTPNRIEMDHGFVAVMNDYIRVYVLLDVLESNVNNSGVNPNDFWVTFDTNNDAQITPSVDINYAMEAGTYNMRYQHYIAPAQWTLLSTTTKSSLGPGFDCYTPDNTKVLQISPPQFNCAAHQIWEIAIDLNEINALPGQIIHMGLRTHSPNPNFSDEMPNALDVDFSNLITVQLAGPHITPPTPGSSIAFASPPFEITQVVQDVNNSIQLIANKTTAGRVSVQTIGASTPQPVIEYLYGVSSGGPDMPGSPLAQLIFAPPTVDRGKLTDTANFLLPPSWIGQGEVIFHAEASDYNGNNITSTPKLLNFQHKNKPVYWMIQENFGTANSPNLMTQATLNSFESYVNTVFPVPEVTWVQKPWTVLGALNGMSIDNNVAAVENYYASTSAIYWTLINQNKVPPFDLPDIIFGAGNFGGGISDPTWFNNSPGHAAVGGFASSGEGVAAHEFNHDLDRSSSGTWGRHVNACGAQGPDPNWPFGTDPAIHEYGFDTRLPWQNTTTSKTVVPTSFPDLMSYCQSGVLPTKWVSPYRYNNWVSSGFPLAPVKTGNNAPAVVPVDSLYLSGSVDVTGTGKLDPALLAPGVPPALSASGAYTLTLLGSGGATLAKQAFDITFQDVEGNPVPTVFFHFVLQNPGGVTGYRLLHAGETLAAVDMSAAPPTAAFTFPTGGENLSGTVNVTWNLSDTDTPLVNLRQNLAYSADDGNTWMPVAANLPGTLTSYALDTNLLPKSTLGKLRLWVTDGLNNIQIDSSGVFSVPDHSPLVNILSPTDNGFIPGNSQMLLQGQAADVEEPNLADNNFLWRLDGNTTLGIGRSVQVVLPTGMHTLSLTVLDSDGLSGSASVTVFVDQFRVFLSMIAK